MKPRIAVFGATGAVGTIVCRLLQERKFPFADIRFFGSPQSRLDRFIEFGGQSYPVEPLVSERVHDLDLVIASTPDAVAAACAPWVVAAGGLLIDESAAHRMQDEVPLVIPEVNPDAARQHQGIISSPNCSTTQLALCLKPIQAQWGIRRVVVSTYQAASGAGSAARQELLDGSKLWLQGRQPAAAAFESSLPFNLWPKIGGFLQNGSTSEETKMVLESRKILGEPSLPMLATCVRVPVVNCHSEAVAVETENPVTAAEATELFARSPGITVMDDGQNLQLPNPQICDDRDDVLVGRIRQDESVEHGLAFWCVSDNLRKGAATNAVQIAELLLEKGWWK